MIQLFCPAKINLGLDVAHRRAEDGLHFLVSIFLPIDFGDRLEVRMGPGRDANAADAPDSLQTRNELSGDSAIEFEAVTERGASLEDNIVWKALRATRGMQRPAFDVTLVKRVPTGAGLGGGSSDAGTLLRWMQTRFGLADAEIRACARSLGADVPFFLESGVQLVSGIGEAMQPIDAAAGHGVLCLPGLHVPTGPAYQQLKRTLRGAPAPKTLHGLTARARLCLARGDWRGLRELKNDFEGPAFAMFPRLGEIKQAFYAAGADYASMSGSGSSLYALVGSEAAAGKLAVRMQSQFPELRFQAFRFPAKGGELS